MMTQASDEQAAAVAARLSRLPFTRWHAKTLAVVGSAHFFDAFDALTIAFVMPLLVMQWQLSHAEAGLMISIGYLGQMLGAILLGAIAERLGRARILRWALLIIGALSFASAFAWGPAVFLVVRFIQGIGLGGESPVAAAYVNEISPARARGRVVFVLQSTFALGVLITALVAAWVVPGFGWQAMFLIGALPFFLGLFLPRLVPESPYWLIEQRRLDEARMVIARIEDSAARKGPLPEPDSAAIVARPRAARTTPLDLLRNGFAPRSAMIWTVALCTAIAGYGMSNWMPTVYTTVYKLPLNQALHYALATNVAAFLGAVLAINVIDRLGRRWNFLIGLVGNAIPLLTLWYLGKDTPVFTVMILASIGSAFLNFALCGVYVYAPELYPTRLRATGAGAMAAWLRMGSIIGPSTVGLLLPVVGITRVFLVFGIVALIGAVVILLFGPETKGKHFHEITG